MCYCESCPPDKRMRFTRFTLTFLLALLLGLGIGPIKSRAAESPANPSAKDATTNSPLQRIVLVGASVTAGFTESEPLGGPLSDQLRLGRYVEAALVSPHQPVQSFGLLVFFLRPELAGQAQLDRALREEPTLLIGIDFLFWYCYGELPTEEARLQRLEVGLRLLETVKCPLILGDFPDASAAVGHMISRAQMPQLATLEAANRRLKEWVSTRANVRLVPLADFMRAAQAAEPLVIHGMTLPKETTRGLLQADHLHATREGCAVLALAIMDVIAAHPVLASADYFRWDAKEVLRIAAP